MATRYWRGGTEAVAQVETGSITAVDATPSNNTFTVTIGNFSISVAGNTDTNTTASDLRTALNASTHPYFSAITWSGSTNSVVGTADTAGVPFTAALTVSGAGTGTVSDFSTTTANTGPCVFDEAQNWDAGTLPVNSDTVIFANSSINCRWGLNTSLTGLTVYVDQSYTGKLGLDRSAFATSANGDTTTAAAAEYRDHVWTIDASKVEVGRSLVATPPAGSTMIKIDNVRASASELIVHNTASAMVNSIPNVLYKANNASAKVEVRAAPGGVGIDTDVPGSTSTLQRIDVLGGNVSVGPGVTCTTFVQSSGVSRIHGAGTWTTFDQDGGTIYLLEDGWTITTYNCEGGTMYYLGDVSVTAMNIRNGAVVDGRGAKTTRQITSLNMEHGSVGFNPLGPGVSSFGISNLEKPRLLKIE